MTNEVRIAGRTLSVPPTTYIDIPEGRAGTRVVLQWMAKIVREQRGDPLLIALKNSLIEGIPGKKWFAEIRAIFNFVRDEIEYALDPDGIEYLQWPQETLRSGRGDCDCKCILLAALLEIAGHPCRFLGVGFEQDHGEISHVIVQTMAAAEGSWISLDATEDQPAGWSPEDVTSTMLQNI